MNLEALLQGGDLRSLGQSDKAIRFVNSQQQFDELFRFLFHADRVVVMRAADAIEKITIANSGYLAPHKKEMISLMGSAADKELKWHLALMAPRLKLTERELGIAWETLTRWATQRDESRIVRVHSLQGLHDLLAQNKELEQDLFLTFQQVETEKIPSINARIRKLRSGKK
jgi:hypothetical protein